MAVGHRQVGVVPAVVPAHSALGVEKSVLLVDVERLVIKSRCVVVEFVVVTIDFITHKAELQVAEDVPLRVDVYGGFQKVAVVHLRGVRVVVSVAAACQVFFPYEGVAGVVEETEVAAVEPLDGASADEVDVLVLVVDGVHDAVGVLGGALLAHKVGTLDVVAVVVGGGQSELAQLVVGPELLVVAVAVGVVGGGHHAQLVVDGPRRGEDVVVLPEVVGGLVP